MTDPAALRQAIAAASRAKAILGDEIVAGALDAIEAELRANWESSDPGDREGREAAYRMIRVAKAFRDRLGKAISDGAMARAEIEDQGARQRRADERAPG
jgi:hypothetical protein